MKRGSVLGSLDLYAGAGFFGIARDLGCFPFLSAVDSEKKAMLARVLRMKLGMCCSDSSSESLICLPRFAPAAFALPLTYTTNCFGALYNHS